MISFSPDQFSEFFELLLVRRHQFNKDTQDGPGVFLQKPFQNISCHNLVKLSPAEHRIIDKSRPLALPGEQPFFVQSAQNCLYCGISDFRFRSEPIKDFPGCTIRSAPDLLHHPALEFPQHLRNPFLGWSECQFHSTSCDSASSLSAN